MRRAQGVEDADSDAEPEVNGNGNGHDDETNGATELTSGALCRAWRARAIRHNSVGAGLRQALVILRIPDVRTRRQRHHRHDRKRAQRSARRFVPD